MWDHIIGLLFENGITFKNERDARHNLIKKAKLVVNFDVPMKLVFGCNRHLLIFFFITLPKQWKLMLKADRTQHILFAESMDLVNISQKNKYLQ